MRRAFPVFAILAVAVVAASACRHTDGGGGQAPASHARPEGAHDQAIVSEVGLAVPIAPGKTEAWQQALAALLGPRYEEYDTSRRRYGVTSQTTFLQRTPMGDFALIHFTGPDVRKSFHAMSESKDPWDVGWRELTLDLHGVDFAKGVEVFPKVERLFWSNSGKLAGTRPFMFLAPITREGAHELRAMSSELMGARHAEYVAARARVGVQREVVFLQSTAAGDAVVFYWLAADPKASLRSFRESTAPLDEYLRSRAREFHPLDPDVLQGIVTENILVADYPRAK